MKKQPVYRGGFKFPSPSPGAPLLVVDSALHDYEDGKAQPLRLSANGAYSSGLIKVIIVNHTHAVWYVGKGLLCKYSLCLIVGQVTEDYELAIQQNARPKSAPEETASRLPDITT